MTTTQTPSQSPKLQVPERRPRERSAMSGLVFVLLLIVLVVQILNMFVSPVDRTVYPVPAREEHLSVEQIQKAALELERKNVSAEAADLWEQYLGVAHADGAEEGRIRYRIGKNRQNASQPDRAYAQFVLAEMLLGEAEPDLREEIGRRRRECLRRMGNLGDLAREVAERAAPPGADVHTGEQVVAEIGAEKITVADFDRMIKEQIDLAVKSRPGITPDEEQINRERLTKQFADPQRRAESLHSLIVTRVLADEARKQQLHESPDFRQRLTAVADSVLAQTLLFDEISKRATVTDEDVKRYYEANKATYAQPAASFIAHIQCDDEATARDVIARLNNGAAFEDLAKSESRDASTRDKLGILADPVPADGDFVPLFGNNTELHVAIRDADAGAVLAEPWQGPNGWHVIKVMSHRVAQDQPFEETKDQVRRDTIAARQREVTGQYVMELEMTYGVKLYPEALGATTASTPAPTAAADKP